jgi:predicted dehydrogenase
MKIAIIGTSPITEQHIKSIKKLNGEIALISSTRKNSKLLPYLAKKYKIKNKFYNWKHAINFASKLKNMAFLISGRLSHNRRILNKCVKLNRKIFIEKLVFLKS